MKRIADLQQHTPKLARVSTALIAGGAQNFPTDPIGDAYRTRIVREQAKREGRKLTRRIARVA